MLALRHERPGDYVFGSGVGRTVGELVDTAFAAAGVERLPPATAATASRSTRASCGRRSGAPPVADPAKAREQLGWRPRRSFEQLVGEMVAADLALLA